MGLCGCDNFHVKIFWVDEDITCPLCSALHDLGLAVSENEELEVKIARADIEGKKDEPSNRKEITEHGRPCCIASDKNQGNGNLGRDTK